jgi:DNA-binding GntR family transcriptional regulator
MTATNPRDAVFRELQTLVGEYDAAVSPENADAHWDVNEALAHLIIKINGETRLARKLQQIQKTDVAFSAA